MSRPRRLLVATGVVLAVAATVAALPGESTTAGFVAAFDSGYHLVAAFGVVTLGAAGAVLSGRAVAGPTQAATPNAEGVDGAPRFGASFDESVAEAGGLSGWFAGEGRVALRDRLREEAIRAEMAADGCRRAEAERRITAGEWTDDPEAAAFLGAESPSPLVRLRALARRETWFRRGARRTAAAVVANAEEARR